MFISQNSWISIRDLAKKYNVSTTAIGYINTGRNYRWLTEGLFNDYPIRPIGHGVEVKQPRSAGQSSSFDDIVSTSEETQRCGSSTGKK